MPFARSGRSKNSMKRNSLGKAAEVIAFLRANSEDPAAFPKSKTEKAVAKPAKKSPKKRP